MTTITLTLSDLSCGHCVKNVQKTLEAMEGVEKAEVTLDCAIIESHLDPEILINAIIEAGYQAKLAEDNSHPKSNLLPETTPCSIKNPDPMVVEQNTDQVLLLLSGLTCIACVNRVEKALWTVPHVQNVQINLAEQTALVSGSTNPQQLISAVQQAGYGAEFIEDMQSQRQKQQQKNLKEIQQRKWQGISALTLGLALMFWGLLGGTMKIDAHSRIAWLCVGVLTFLIMFFAGGHFYRSAVKNALKKTATMDTLVALGTGSAWLYSMFVCLNPEYFPENARHLYFEASAMIIGLINLGKMLEAKAKQRSSQALERLLDLTPPTAIIVNEQGEREIPLQQVKQGMTLRLQTGARVPVDGMITQGVAWVDESMLTGEPLPIEKKISDRINAGTLVTDGTLLFQAEQVGSQTTLANIIRLVRQAQSSKPQLTQLTDKISAVFVPTVIVIAFIAALIWYGLQQNYAYSLVIFTTVLIIACPCALGLAIPMSMVTGVGRAAELGILVRDVDALQKAAKADVLVFDKTGTLTKGEPNVTALFAFNTFTEQQILTVAASLEQGSSHPIAKAILTAAQEKNANLQEIHQFQTLGGLGLQGKYLSTNSHNMQSCLIGNQTLMDQHKVELTLAESAIQQYLVQGATLVFLAIEQQLAGLFVIQDSLREDSLEALQRLKEENYQLVMLTGDQLQSAQYAAQTLPIDQIIAGVLPEGKANAIKTLQQQGHTVVMVGDGINDAPALAQADVSLAMGSGSDIAIETADLTLMRHNISTVADSLILSKGILRNIKQNLFGAFIYNIMGIPIAAGVLYPLFGLLLDPMIAGAAMALSSITVVSNANRLLKFNAKK